MKVKTTKVQFYTLPWENGQVYSATENQAHHHDAIKLGEPVEVVVPVIGVCECCGQDVMP